MKRIFIFVIFLAILVQSRIAKGDIASSCAPFDNTFLSGRSVLLSNGQKAVLTYDGSEFWTKNIPGAQWIWNDYYVSDPQNGQIVDFFLPLNVKGNPTSAVLKVAADDYYKIFVSSKEVASEFGDGNFLSGNIHILDITNYLKSGDNVVSFQVTNAKYFWPSNATPQNNPAGLLYSLRVKSLDCPALLSPPPSPQPATPLPSSNEVTLTANSANNSNSGSSSGAVSYTIFTLTNGNGYITPSGPTSVLSGNNQSYTIVPIEGYKINEVLVDGTSVGAVQAYNFTNVGSNHTINARFSPSLHLPSSFNAGIIQQALNPANNKPALANNSNENSQKFLADNEVNAVNRNTANDNIPKNNNESKDNQLASLSDASGSRTFFGWLLYNLWWIVGLIILSVLLYGFWPLLVKVINKEK